MRLYQDDRPDKIPFDFVLDNLASLNPVVGQMFGCFSIYVGGKIMLILRDRREPECDNGVWIATTKEHHASLAEDFPSMRSISVLGRSPTAWQNLPCESDTFEQDVAKICGFILRHDSRIGKIPAKKSKRKTTKSK